MKHDCKKPSYVWLKKMIFPASMILLFISSSLSAQTLQNGVPVNGLSASTGNDVVYSINVPSGASNLVIKISGGSGDADLYTRAGSVPTDSTYACRPYAGGNSETCTEPNPSAGTWYARVKAYESFSNVTLTASYTGGGSSSGGSSSGGSSSGGSSSGGNQLQNGVPVTGLSASAGNDVVYSINVPSGASNLVIKISGGSGDADLYTRAGSVPTDSTYACRPYAGGNSETCTEPNPSAGTWYARVKAYESFSGLTLTASYTSGGSSSGGSSSGGSSSGGSSSGGSSSGGSSSGGSSSGGSSSSSGGNQLQNGVPVNGLSASAGNDVVYSINVPSGASNLVIKISGGSGDADLYTRAGSVPTDSTYACRPYAGGNSETCTEPNPSAGIWYARVKAYESFSNVTLTASYTGGGSSSGGSSSGGSSSGGSSSGGSSSGGSSSGGSSSGGTDTLANGVPITNISGASGSEKKYFIHIHGDAPSNLVIKTSGGSGDVDLYVKQGSEPTTSDYDCRPYAGGNTETCTIPSPVHGPYFIMLRGYEAYSGVTLSGSYSMGGSSSGGSSSGGSSSGGSSSGGSSSGGNNEYGLQNACDLGRPAQGNTHISLGQAICTQNSSGQTNFKYTPTSSDVGKDILFTIGHGNGVAGLTANQDFNGYATEADFNANPNIVYGSFGFDPTDQSRTYNFVIVPNVQANKDIWISLNAGNSSFSGVSLKGEVIVPVDLGNLPDACQAGETPQTDQYIDLNDAVCGQSSQGPGYYTHFTYRPTAEEAGKSFLLEMGHGTGNANMTVNQHYSDSPNSGGTAFAHEEHLSDRPDLVFMSFRPGVEQRVIYPNAAPQEDIFVVIPPGPNGFSTFTFRIRALD